MFLPPSWGDIRVIAIGAELDVVDVVLDLDGSDPFHRISEPTLVAYQWRVGA